MKKYTPLQVLTKHRDRPNATVGNFGDAMRKAGYEWVGGNDPDEAAFINGNITCRKGDVIFSYAMFDDALAAAIRNEEDPEEFKKTNVIMQQAIHNHMEFHKEVSAKTSRGESLTPKQRKFWWTECGAYHLQKEIERLTK